MLKVAAARESTRDGATDSGPGRLTWGKKKAEGRQLGSWVAG